MEKFEFTNSCNLKILIDPKQMSKTLIEEKVKIEILKYERVQNLKLMCEREEMKMDIVLISKITHCARSVTTAVEGGVAVISRD